MSDESPARSPRSDLKDGLAWIVFGAAVLIGSLTMDRLEAQHINPYTVPGLLPALLGIAMVLLGGVLTARSWRRGALQAQPAVAADGGQRRRIWIVIALCVGYGVVLVGHGIPFWLASTIYVTASILILQRLGGAAEGGTLTPKAWLKALAIGFGSSIVTYLVFQELFLVRMP